VREVSHLFGGERGEARVRGLRRDEDLVCVAREVWEEGDCRVVLGEDASAVPSFCCDDVVEESAPRLFEIVAAYARLVLNRLEDEVGRVNLAVRVRVRDAYDLALVLEGEHMRDLRPAAQLDVLLAPHAQ